MRSQKKQTARQSAEKKRKKKNTAVAMATKSVFRGAKNLGG
jgi:hypothetical protein